MPDLFLSVWALPELVEAAVNSGRPRLAAEACERLADSASVSGTDWGLGIATRSRALVSEGEAAESCYSEAVARLIARGCVRSSPAPTCSTASGFAARIVRSTRASSSAPPTSSSRRSAWRPSPSAPAAELLAMGERLRTRSVESRDDLTAQERQIAQLARDGLSNPEIGARLFLSPRTVEWHLHHVFTKLGIRSRQQLVRGVPAFDSEAVPR